MAAQDFAARAEFPEDDYRTEEATAEDTLALVAAGRPSREEIRRRMDQDFPAD